MPYHNDPRPGHKVLALSAKFAERRAKQAAQMKAHREKRPKTEVQPTKDELRACVNYIKLKGRLPSWAPKRWNRLFVIERALNVYNENIKTVCAQRCHSAGSVCLLGVRLKARCENVSTGR